MNINTYLKEKLKERNIQVEDLIHKSGSSKSTVYRVMTGMQKPSKKLREKLFEILELSPREQQEFNYYVSTSDVDENILNARESIREFLFHSEASIPGKIELIYYDDEKYIRTFEDVLDNIIEVSDRNNFSCNFRMINCINKDITSCLSMAAKKLYSQGSFYSIEHLVTFSTYDYKENINTLSGIIPLSILESYVLKYREEEKTSNYGFFHDFMIVDFSYLDDNNTPIDTTYYITFLQDALSACYVGHGDNESAHDFFRRNYDSLNEKYQTALNSRKSLLEYILVIKNLYLDHNNALFRPHIPLSRVTMSVYRSIMKRTPVDEFVRYFLQEKYNQDNLESHVEELLSYAEAVIEATYKNKPVDIYSKSGLEAFASTGLILDQLEFLPALNKSEIKAILTSLKSRDLDPQDPLNIFIIEESYAEHNLEVVALENYGLLIEKYVDSNTPYCIIEHKGFSDIFKDFADNYVPYMMAIPNKDAHDYIDYLIEKYC